MLPYVRQGRKSPCPLILLHFLGGSHRTWFSVLPRLDAELECLSPDMPGFGLAAQIPLFTVQQQVNLLVRTLDAAGVSKCFLAGHSMSGKIAAVFALQHPERVAGLILIAPSPLSPQPMSGAQYAQQKDWQGTRQEAEEFIDGACYRRLPDFVRDIATGDALAASHAAFHAWAASGSQENWLPDAQPSPVPALLIQGCDDPSVPDAGRQENLILSPFAEHEVVTLPEAGHLLPLEKPAELARLILGFVKSRQL